MEFFRTAEITLNITRITDPTGAHVFLIEGRERALLIDTANGLGNLREFVETLTNKPLTVVLTHGHCDHAGGAGCFQNVYLNPLDHELVRTHASMENRREYVEFCLGEDFAQLKPEDFAPVFTGDYLPLTDGMVFDLGGVTAKAVELPGHTHGMTGFLFPEERILLAGDACNHFTFLFDEEASTVEELREKLSDIWDERVSFDHVLLSHGDETLLDISLIKECMQICDKIMRREDDAVPFYFLGSEGLVAMKTDENRSRLDGGFGNIVYNKNKIFKKDVQEEQLK